MVSYCWYQANVGRHQPRALSQVSPNPHARLLNMIEDYAPDLKSYLWAPSSPSIPSAQVPLSSSSHFGRGRLIPSLAEREGESSSIHLGGVERGERSERRCKGGEKGGKQSGCGNVRQKRKRESLDSGPLTSSRMIPTPRTALFGKLMESIVRGFQFNSML